MLGTTVGVRGIARLHENRSNVTLVPIEVDSSTDRIVSRFETTVKKFKDCFS